MDRIGIQGDAYVLLLEAWAEVLSLVGRPASIFPSLGVDRLFFLKLPCQRRLRRGEELSFGKMIHGEWISGETP